MKKEEHDVEFEDAVEAYFVNEACFMVSSRSPKLFLRMLRNQVVAEACVKAFAGAGACASRASAL